jgi:hypothetical protein
MDLVIELSGRIETDHHGIKKLLDFRDKITNKKGISIYIDFSHLKWIDANLSSLFSAILEDVITSNNVSFSTNYTLIESRFDVLLRNGFIKDNNRINDDRRSTVANKRFNINDKKEFVSYIDNDLLRHRGMRRFSKGTKEQISSDIIEIFSNIKTHAPDSKHFYSCGQYYPNKDGGGRLVFSMVDKGDGFLPAIQRKVNKIITDREAIEWAIVNGNTTRVGVSGGLGLSKILEFAHDTNGGVQIITGNAFYDFDFMERRKFCHSINRFPFGSMVNIIYR